jgi:hypothetical protein
MNKLSVPRHRIPKVSALCPQCGAGTKIISAVPHAEGYHRRHQCRRTVCGKTFYTLAPYDGGVAVQSSLPFKDRPLTEFEYEERASWWTEDVVSPVAPPITSGGNDDSFLRRIEQALNTSEDKRTPADTIIVQVYEALAVRVAKMDADQGEYE